MHLPPKRHHTQASMHDNHSITTSLNRRKCFPMKTKANMTLPSNHRSWAEITPLADQRKFSLKTMLNQMWADDSHRTRKQPQSKAHSSPWNPNDIQPCVVKLSTDPDTRISYAIPTATMLHTLTHQQPNYKPAIKTNRAESINPWWLLQKTRSGTGAPPRDLHTRNRLTHPPGSLARPRSERERQGPHTWAAVRSSSAAMAAAAVEWPRQRSRSTRCSWRCSAKPRSIRSDDSMSSPREPESWRAPDRAPDRPRLGGDVLVETLAALVAPHAHSHWPAGERERVGKWRVLFSSFSELWDRGREGATRPIGYPARLPKYKQ